MNGQMSIQDFLKIPSPGDWVGEDALGEEMTFGEAVQNVGNIIIIEKSTESHAWYKVVLVERIHIYDDGHRRLVYYDGKKQRGLVDEMYFDKSMRFCERAWKLRE